MKERKRKITMRVKSLIAASNETRVALVIMNTISKILYDVYICTYVRMCTYVSVCVWVSIVATFRVKTAIEYLAARDASRRSIRSVAV